MRPVKPAPITAEARSATVVFVRPSGVGPNTKVTILDGTRFLGDSLPNSYFVTHVEPGRHLFVGWAANTTGMEATVAPGRIYFVHVDVKLGALSSRTSLLAMRPAPKRGLGLDRLQRYEADERRGQASLRRDEHETHERVRKAAEIVARFGPREKNSRALRVEDGLPE